MGDAELEVGRLVESVKERVKFVSVSGPARRSYVRVDVVVRMQSPWRG